MAVLYGQCGICALVHAIGAGGQAQVFLGVQHGTLRLFAIKFFDRDVPGARTAMMKEAEALRALRHPNIVAFEGHGDVFWAEYRGPYAPPHIKPGYAGESMDVAVAEATSLWRVPTTDRRCLYLTLVAMQSSWSLL